MEWLRNLLPGSRSPSSTTVQPSNAEGLSKSELKKGEKTANKVAGKALKAHEDAVKAQDKWLQAPPSFSTMQKQIDKLTRLAASLDGQLKNKPIPEERASLANRQIQQLNSDIFDLCAVRDVLQAESLMRVALQGANREGVSENEVSGFRRIATAQVEVAEGVVGRIESEAIVVAGVDNPMERAVDPGIKAKLAGRVTSMRSDADEGTAPLPKKKGGAFSFITRHLGGSKQRTTAESISRPASSAPPAPSDGVRQQEATTESKGLFWRIVDFIFPDEPAGRDFTQERNASAPDSAVVVQRDNSSLKFPAPNEIPHPRQDAGESWSFQSFEEGVAHLHETYLEPLLKCTDAGELSELGVAGNVLYEELVSYTEAVSKSGEEDISKQMSSALNHSLLPNKFTTTKGKEIPWDHIYTRTSQQKKTSGMREKDYVKAMRAFGAKQLIVAGRKPSSAGGQEAETVLRDAGKVPKWGRAIKSDPVVGAMTRRVRLLRLAGPEEVTEANRKKLEESRKTAMLDLYQNALSAQSAFKFINEVRQIEGMNSITSKSDRRDLFDGVEAASRGLAEFMEHLEACVEPESKRELLVSLRSETGNDVQIRRREIILESLDLPKAEKLVTSGKLEAGFSDSMPYLGQALRALPVIAQLTAASNREGSKAHQLASSDAAKRVVEDGKKRVITGANLFEQFASAANIISRSLVPVTTGLRDMAQTYPPGETKDAVADVYFSIGDKLEAGGG